MLLWSQSYLTSIAPEKIMPDMKALDKLLNKNNDNKFVCVGLDSDLNKIPKFILKEKEPIYFFNEKIIEATKNHVAAYKINFAFYEAFGSYGFDLIEETIDKIPSDVLIIADAKRGDIGNTSEMYAKAIFENFKFDSVTVNPYMGTDSLEPFINYKDKLIFILGLTSNPGADDFQKAELKDGSKLFQFVISKTLFWNNTNNNCGIVFGATKMEDLIDNLELMRSLPILLPGVGTQGGNFSDVLKVFNSYNRKNFIVNLSRTIIYSDDSFDFDKSAEREVINLNHLANQIFNL
jgi:orotidine-5'-phosphate decarboxylase